MRGDTSRKTTMFMLGYGDTADESELIRNVMLLRTSITCIMYNYIRVMCTQ